jgi:hypothetical protein
MGELLIFLENYKYTLVSREYYENAICIEPRKDIVFN